MFVFLFCFILQCLSHLFPHFLHLLSHEDYRYHVALKHCGVAWSVLCEGEVEERNVVD